MENWYKRVHALTDKSKAKLLETPESLEEKVKNANDIDVRISLYPTEKLTWCYRENSPWSAATARSFLNASNTRLILRELDLVNPSVINYLETKNINAVRDEGNTFLESLDEQSYILFSPDKSYPLLDIFLDVAVSNPGTNGPVCHIMNGTDVVASADPLYLADEGRFRYRLRRALIRAKIDDYVSVKLIFNGNARISMLRIISIFQVSHPALPVLNNGENFIEITCADKSLSFPMSISSHSTIKH